MSTQLSNNDWARLVRDKLEDLNHLLMEAHERDVIATINQREAVVGQPPLLVATLSERL